MDFEFSQEQLMLKDTVRSFIRKEYPEEAVRLMCSESKRLSAFEAKLAELGISGICLPEQYGGEALGPMETAVVIEALSRFSIDFGMTCGVNLTAGMALVQYGTEALKNRYLPELISGQGCACFGYSEPFTFGRGKPACVGTSNKSAVEIQIDTVYCENKDPATGILFLPAVINGHSTIAVLDLAELKDGQVLKTVGRNLLGQQMYPPQKIRFNPEQIFNSHAKLIPSVMNNLKFFNVMSMIGNMKTVVDRTIQYAKAREQFGQAIGKFQAIGHMIVDAKIGSDSSTAYAYYLAWQLEKSLSDSSGLTRSINMAGTFVSQSYLNAANTAIQVMGGYGYMNESHIERYARDARMAGFYCEDSYAQKIAIANELAFDHF
ncbi:MAG: hypothetical protein VR64_12305 [Desulfatitalea sp. BRH_c12]|nr:MAG: hypothetical protein VR64_12305 [Desulfatitalea sp. BRH_c12]